MRQETWGYSLKPGVTGAKEQQWETCTWKVQKDKTMGAVKGTQTVSEKKSEQCR